MATQTIKSYNTDDQAFVTPAHELLVTGNVTASNPSVGTAGQPAPTSVTEVGGVDPSGNLQPIKVDSSGAVIVSNSGNGFSNLSPGYPTQRTVGTTSVTIIPANSGRKYAHVANNSGESIFIQYQVSASLNQGVKIGPGGFFTLEIDNLYKGDINAIGLMAGQLIDVLEGI